VHADLLGLEISLCVFSHSTLSMGMRRRHADNLQHHVEDEEDMDAYRVTYHTDMVSILITPYILPPPPHPRQLRT